MSEKVQYINPEGLNKNPAFSNVFIVSKGMKTVFIGGQDSINASGEIIGKGDLKKQTQQVFKNLKIALDSANATLEDVFKWNVYIVEWIDP